MPQIDLNGARIAYAQAGFGEIVLLLHSTASAGAQWQALAGALGSGYSVFAPDLYGYGESDPWPGHGPFALAEEAALAEAVLADAGQGPIHLIGHSYGGLFGTYVLLTEPDLFKRYVIVSPSLWYSDGIAFQMEAAAAANGQPSNVNVFLSVGALEDSRMPSDLRTLYDRLKRRHHPGLKLAMQIFDGERHDSVFPGAVSRGLRTVFEALGPRPPR